MRSRLIIGILALFAPLWLIAASTTPSITPNGAAVIAGKTAAAVAPGAYDVDAAAYFAAIAARGSTISTANKAAVNAFVIGCKTDNSPNGGVSNWAAIQEFCLLAGPDDLTGALTPLKGSGPTNTNFVSGDENRLTGLLGDASTKYLTCARDNAADGQDNNSNGVYITVPSSGGNAGFISTGTTSVAGNNNLIFNTTQVFVRSRSSSSIAQSSGTNPSGLLGISRSSSTTVSLYFNGTTYALSQTSQTPAAGTLYVFRRQTSEVSDMRCAAYWIGAAVDQPALAARLATYIAALQ